MKPTAFAPLIKTLTVPISPDRAFDLFTRRMAEWWPLHSHAISAAACKAPARSVHVPDRVGDEVIETLADGSTAPWGRITAYAPGAHFAMTWHPGTPAETASLVDVRFSAEGAGCRVTLTHSGWENRPDGAARRVNYDSGWNGVLLGDYANAAQGDGRAHLSPGHKDQA